MCSNRAQRLHVIVVGERQFNAGLGETLSHGSGLPRGLAESFERTVALRLSLTQDW
ncbi:MAG: hypothetical protein ACKVP7_17265 [Hyphomicrobiaceae bacterium]